MSRIVDQDGKPFNPSPLSTIARDSFAILKGVMDADAAAAREFSLALTLNELRRSCGVAGDPMGATVSVRRPARYVPKEST